jgi:hypothetical protein
VKWHVMVPGAQAEDVVSARLSQQRLDILHLIVETVVFAVRAAHAAATTVRDIERELVPIARARVRKFWELWPAPCNNTTPGPLPSWR